MARYRKNRKAAVLVLAMIALCIISAWAASVAAMSGVNLDIADNYRTADTARASAESGLEVIRYLLQQTTINGSLPADQRLTALANALQAQLDQRGMSNFALGCNGSQITIEDVRLATTPDQTFNVAIQQTSPDSLQARITGTSRQITRTLQAGFSFTDVPKPVFDYGVATRGPLGLTGNADLLGVNDPSEAAVYIESLSAVEALSLIGNCALAGRASIANPAASVGLTGASSIAGLPNVQNNVNVFIGVDAVELPLPDTTSFRQYTQNVIDSDTETSGNLGFQNVLIEAGTDPSFSGNIEFQGIIFVESPNTLAFSGNITITGLMVCEGDPDYPDENDSVSFTGNLFTNDVSNLPDQQQFVPLKNLTGSFLLAPGFSVTFDGNFHTVNGTIAATGITFGGNAGGTVKGSVINYAEDRMTLTGNPTLNFDRSDFALTPAGFDPDLAVTYDAETYSEITL